MSFCIASVAPCSTEPFAARAHKDHCIATVALAEDEVIAPKTLYNIYTAGEPTVLT
jgi:hypothetical protein